ncbi:MucR family transcriptional regulator [Devosia sp. 919]|uniref:MucR family transcriptional regulator n=1 Tax=Devosia sp. 919 TaxID=2726065 RepID=UPI001552EEAA|nr:MucR family transcriptional regulator [Devosia sp. 919]
MTATTQELTAQIVSSYLSNNQVQADVLPAVLQSVYDKLNSLGTSMVQEPAAPAAPAVPIEKSITHDHLICLEDGKKFKSLKRHLQTKFNMTPEEYRAKWGLPGDYPMVAPGYSAKRSQLAKNSGLGVRALQKAA